MRISRFGVFVWPAVILLLGCFTRFYGIGYRSIWFDEAVSWSRSQYPAYHSPFVSSDPHPPLYFFLLSLWSKLFQSHNPSALRALSACFSILVLVYSCLITYKLARREIALGVACFLAFSSWQIAHAQQIRMYALLSLCVIAAAYHLYVALEQKGKIKAVHLLLFSVWMFLGNQTHFLSLFSFAGFFLWGMFLATDKNKFAVFLVFFAVLFFSAAFFWPFLHALIEKPSSASSFRPVFHAGRELREVLYYFTWYGDILQRPKAFPGWVAALFGFLLTGAGLFSLPRQTKVLFFFWLGFPLLCAISFSFFRNIFYAKYFVYLHPLWIILMVHGAYRVAQRFKTPSVFLFFILTPLFLANILSWRTLQTFDPFPWESVAFCLQHESHKNDVWILSEPGRSMVLDYYLGSGTVAGRSPFLKEKSMEGKTRGGLWLIFGESPYPERERAFLWKFSWCAPVKDCSYSKIYAFRCKGK